MQIPVGFAQAAVQFRYVDGGRPQVVTYGVGLEGTDFGQTRAATIYQIWADEYLPEITTNTRLEQVSLKYGPVSTGATYLAVGSATGTANVPVAPPNVSFLVQKKTSFGGRMNRGRMYPPGVAEAAVGNDGSVAGGTLGPLQAAMDGILSAHDAAGLPWVVLHASSSDPTPVSQLVLDSRVATQRRRLRG